MSPRTKKTSMAKASASVRVSRKSTQCIPRTIPGSASLCSPSFPSDTSYQSRSRSETLRSDDSLMWNGPFPNHLSGHDDAHFDSLHMDPLALSNSSYMVSVIPGSDCYDTPAFDQFTQGPMSQTLAGPLLESPYHDIMMGDDVINSSPMSMGFPGYGQPLQHTWRHGQLSPPAEIFHPELNDFSLDPACDIAFQHLPESAIPGTLSYEKLCTSVPRHGQPRPLRSASEKSTSTQSTLAPQDTQYYRSDRADKVKARNDPRYEASPDKDGYYHCPIVDETCNHKPTKQKCIYAKYLDSHLKPYACTHGEKGSECDGARFSSNACLFRHEREAHGMHNHGLNPYLCVFPGCERSRDGNGFPRRWNQRDHMKRVHDWEEPETYDNQDRSGTSDSNKRRKSGHSQSTPMKRTTSSHIKSQAMVYNNGVTHGGSAAYRTAHADKQMHSNIMAFPTQFSNAQYSQVSSYPQQPRSSESYPNPFLLSY